MRGPQARVGASVAVALALAQTPWAAYARPPLGAIDYSGRLRSAHRWTLSEAGSDSLHNSWTGQLNLGSYAWRPWLATWSGSFNASKLLTYSDVDSSGSVITGEGQVRIFPTSRFPLYGYAQIQDTRVDFDTPIQTGFDTRLIRYGLQQQYKSLSGKTDYSVNWERSQHDELLSDLRDQTNDVLRLRAKRRGEHHNFSADFDLLNADRKLQPDEFSWQAIGRHMYNHNERLSSDSSIRVSQEESALAGIDATLTRLAADSLTLWRHSTRPFQLSGQINLRSTWGRVGDGAINGFETGTALLGGRYEFTRALSLSGELGYRMRMGAADGTHSFLQRLFGNYSPSPIDLKGFDYSYFGGLSASNEVIGGNGTLQSLRGSLGHGINREFPLWRTTTWVVGFDLGQHLNGLVDSERADLADITHRVALTLNRRGGRLSSQLRTWAFDTRRIAGPSSISQAVNVTASMGQRLTEYSDWSTSATFSYLRAGQTAGEAESAPFFGFDLEYRQRRLFSLRGLSWRSTLRFDSRSFDQFQLGDGGSLLSWENRFIYMIGRFSAELRVTNTNPGPRAINSFFLMLSRTF